MKTLKELGAKVYSGKIIQRLIVDPLNNEEVVDKERRTIVSAGVAISWVRLRRCAPGGRAAR